LWDSPKAPLQGSISALETTLGHKVVPIVRWPILWDALKDRIPGKETFVPIISSIVIAWYERLLFRLENDHFAEWTEKFLTLLSQSHSEVQLHIEVDSSLKFLIEFADRESGSQSSPSPQVSLRTTWQANLGTFNLNIEVAPQVKVVAALDQGFDVLFAPAATTSIVEDGWDDVAEGSTSKTLVGISGPDLAEAAAHGIAASLDAGPREIRLPRVNELSRPNDLFLKMTPYVMTIDFEREGSLLVKSSHEPSLQLMVAYFDRWGRPNVNDSERV